VSSVRSYVTSKELAELKRLAESKGAGAHVLARKESLLALIGELEANRKFVSEAGLQITAQQRTIEGTTTGIDSLQEAWMRMKRQRDALAEVLVGVQGRSHGINDHDHRDLVLRLLDIAKMADTALGETGMNRDDRFAQWARSLSWLQRTRIRLLAMWIRLKRRMRHKGK
jgi:hypothetical protein